MKKKIIKTIIALLSAAVVMSLIMAAVNYVYGDRSDFVPGAPAVDAQKALNEAHARNLDRLQSLPSYRTSPSTGTAGTGPQGSLMVVKSRDFGGVAESPKDLLAALNEMAGGDEKEKPAPIHLTESDLNKKISVAPPDRTGTLPGAYRMPGLGDGSETQAGTLNMIKAPVDFEVYKTSESWQAFANTHKWRAAPSVQGQAGDPGFPGMDFSQGSIVVLVSVSDLPNGIFKITGVTANARNIVVRYRVDPLAISSESKTREYDHYSAAVVPKKDLPVKLEQAP